MASEITEKFLSKHFGARVINQKKKLCLAESVVLIYFLFLVNPLHIFLMRAKFLYFC